MFLNRCGCHSGVGDLGFDPFAAAGAIMSLMNSGDSGSIPAMPFGGGGGGGGGGGVTVSPVIQTSISPQISPVFQQAFQPQNAPMTAGTTQTMPVSQSATTGQPGMGMPGLPPLPGDVSSGPDPFMAPMPDAGGAVPMPRNGAFSIAPRSPSNMLPLLFIGGGLLALVFLLKKKRKA